MHRASVEERLLQRVKLSVLFEAFDGFNFAPTGWALCNGQLLTISQNTALFSILGTYYGGNGTSNFALPNLQAAAPLAAGNGAPLCEAGPQCRS